MTTEERPENQEREVKGMGGAVASIVCGLLGLFTCGLTAILGLVLGIRAFMKINASKGIKKGRKAALAGIIISSIMLPPVTLPLTGLGIFFRGEIMTWVKDVWDTPNGMGLPPAPSDQWRRIQAMDAGGVGDGKDEGKGRIARILDEMDAKDRAQGLFTSKEIRTNRLVILDDNGKARATLTVDKNGPRLLMVDENGRPRAFMGASKVGATLDLWGENGKGGATLSAHKEGPTLFLTDENDKTLWSAPPDSAKPGPRG